MSYIRRIKTAENSSKVQNTESKLYLQLNVVPIPKATGKYNPEQKEKQQSSIAMIQARGRDLFDKNSTRVTLENDKRLYQSEMLYGKVLSVEEMIPMLTAQDLTLRINAVRTGSDSHSTCMELKTGVLADLLEEAADSKGDKVSKIKLADESRGSMFVALKEYKGAHYIQKVDYEVSKEVDDTLHV